MSSELVWATFIQKLNLDNKQKQIKLKNAFFIIKTQKKFSLLSHSKKNFEMLLRA